jgi:hypothetical protein
MEEVSFSLTKSNSSSQYEAIRFQSYFDHNASGASWSIFHVPFMMSSKYCTVDLPAV